jgi:hypothetical protein
MGQGSQNGQRNQSIVLAGRLPDCSLCWWLDVYRATEEEIAKAARAGGLCALEVNEPSALAVALILNGGDYMVEVRELEKACYPLFSLEEWPDIERTAYDESRMDAERRKLSFRRWKHGRLRLRGACPSGGLNHFIGNNSFTAADD